MRSNLDFNDIRSARFVHGMRFAQQLLTIAADQTLIEGASTYLGFDPSNTNRNVTLYTPTNTKDVTFHRLVHFGTGTGQLVVKNPAAATIGTLDPGFAADLIFFNGAWSFYADKGGTAGANNQAKYTAIIPIGVLTGLANAQTWKLAIPHAFTVTSIGVRIGVPVTTAAKAATLTAQVNGAAVTGGVVSLTSANATPTGALVAGTAITGANTGTAGQTVEAAISSVTAFLEGSAHIEFGITNTT